MEPDSVLWPEEIAWYEQHRRERALLDHVRRALVRRLRRLRVRDPETVARDVVDEAEARHWRDHEREGLAGTKRSR